MPSSNPDITWNGAPVTTWPVFAKEVRSQGCSLLSRLDRFPDALLVAGCQRSGTTILSRVLSATEGMAAFQFGPDDELDAGLLLAGRAETRSTARHCFQTTYLNECWQEYLDRPDAFRLIWVLRNPYSVVYSMTHNWSRWALNELFSSCAAHLLEEGEKKRFQRFGFMGLSRFRKACLAYAGKSAQIFELAKRLPREQLAVLDYDELVRDRRSVLEQVYAFSGLEFREEYAQRIHTKSVDKARSMRSGQRAEVERVCMPTYLRTLDLRTIRSR